MSGAQVDVRHVRKSFEGGRAALAHLNIPIHSLATISAMDETGIHFEE